MARFLPANQPCRWNRAGSVVARPGYKLEALGEASKFPRARVHPK